MTYKTSIDLVDFMLLLQMKIDASQVFLKGLLLGASVLYLFGFVWFYRRSRKAMKSKEPSSIPAPDLLTPTSGIP
jgi:hypothetical protein